MKSLDEIRKVKNEFEAKLLKIPGVNGIAIGYKEVGGQKTGEISIHVFVDEKKRMYLATN